MAFSATDSVVGVDGCAGGWFAVWSTTSNELNSACYETFAAVVDEHDTADRMLVDMPIGLPESESRACDQEARKQLGLRKNSVFPVPCREVVEYWKREGETATYERAKEINRKHIGSALSVQSWNIVPKIGEIDCYLENGSLSVDIIESHPECCLTALNDGYPIAQSKSTVLGRASRFGILDDELDGWRACYEAALNDYYRNAVARDDIVDALALFAAGRRSLTSLPAEPPRDDAELPMQIVVPDCEPSWEQHVELAER